MLESGRGTRQRFHGDWENYSPPRPAFLGIQAYDRYSLARDRGKNIMVAFFHTWS